MSRPGRAESLPPLRASRGRWGLLLPIGFAALVFWSYRGTGVDLGQLFGAEGLQQIGLYALRLFPPDVSARALREAGAGAVETFAISLVGSVLAVCIAAPLALATTRSLLYRGILYEGRALGPRARTARVAIYAAAKALLNLLRTIPEIL